MPEALWVTLEVGPKGKRVVAVAPDWPGLERGAKTAEAAIARLQAYLPRYAPIVRLAGMGATFPTSDAIEVIEQYPGTGSTDFWGISFAFSAFDQQAMSRGELDRDLALLQACWAYFDAARSRVSAELRKGPRGGGRDRDRIVRHVLGTELGLFAVKVGVGASIDSLLTDEGLRAYRDAFLAAMRTYHAEGKPPRTWPLRYLIRHTAYHALDHAWEMEDRDLTGSPA